MRVLFSSASERDFLDIAEYISEDNPVRALSFVDEIEAKCLNLGGAPAMGAIYDSDAEIRRLPHGNYNIYYRINPDHVRILRILHGARHIDEDKFTS